MACFQAHDLDAAGGGGAGVAGAALRLPEDCEEQLRPGIAPKELRCTGLFTDVEKKEVGPGLRSFAPAYPLWSDDADKRRWVYLPPDTQIDTSNPNEWEFPVGTRFFKEFSWKGQRVETRMYYKESETRWIKATYLWAKDESKAERFVGGEVDINGDSYVVPSSMQCDECHKGSADRALGFEAVMLGLPDAEGLTLEKLHEEGLVTDEVPMDIEIGDDGTERAVMALGWLHTNCGTSCHNGRSASEAFRTGLRLDLEIGRLDGDDVDSYNAIKTTLGEDVTTERWLGTFRIVPGVPEASLLYWLIIQRDPSTPDDQMPPIASRVVDPDGATWVEQWIRARPRDPSVPVEPLF